MSTKFIKEDADSLLALADQFLADWADDAVLFGKRDLQYEKREAEWALYRPLFVAAPAMRVALLSSREALKAAIVVRDTFGGCVGGGQCPYKAAIGQIDLALVEAEGL